MKIQNGKGEASLYFHSIDFAGGILPWLFFMDWEECESHEYSRLRILGVCCHIRWFKGEVRR